MTQTQAKTFKPQSLIGISHVALKAANVEESVAFYRDFLGFAEQERLYHPTDGALTEVIMQVSEHQSIEIFDAARLQAGTDKLCKIAFHVGDAKKVRRHLIANGYSVSTNAPRNEAVASFTVQDGCGYAIEFVQYQCMRDEGNESHQGEHLPDSRISSHITHAGVIVQDMETARRFYMNALHFHELWRGSSDDKVLSWIHVGLATGSDFLEWMLSPSSDPHFCFEVADVEEVKAKLEGRDFLREYSRWGRPLETRIGKNRKRQLNLWDPNGIRVECMEHHTFDGSPIPPPSTAPFPLNLS